MYDLDSFRKSPEVLPMNFGNLYRIFTNFIPTSDQTSIMLIVTDFALGERTFRTLLRQPLVCNDEVVAVPMVLLKEVRPIRYPAHSGVFATFCTKEPADISSDKERYT